MTHRLSALFAFVLLLLPISAAAYTVAPGDRLQVEVLEDSSLNRVLLVLPDGTIHFPGAGSVRVTGRTVASLPALISQRLSSQFANAPTVYVSVAALADVIPADEALEEPTLIYVMGELESPGALQVEEGVTLLQAIAQAGGFTRFAATKRVELHRVDPSTQTEQVYLFDYKNRGGISGGTLLGAGDVIVVPERRLFE
jgi:polysaccharide export outer membrane protein